MKKLKTNNQSEMHNTHINTTSHSQVLFKSVWKSSFPRYKNYFALSTIDSNHNKIEGTSVLYYISNNIPKTIRFKLTGSFLSANIVVINYTSHDGEYRGLQVLNIHSSGTLMEGVFTTIKNRNNHKIQGEIILNKM